MRRTLCALALVGGLGVVVGCNNASSPTVDRLRDKGKDGVDAVQKGAQEVSDKTKELVAKAGKELSDATGDLPKVEEKIGTMSGDAKTKASTALADLKTAVEEAKTAATDPQKWKNAYETVKSKMAALKQQVGL